MAEAVKVIVRCRPLNQREKNLKCNTVVNMDGNRGYCEIRKPKSKDPPKSFTFDGAYFVDSTTEQIYNDIGYPLVDGVLEGYNGTIFAYGQTGCGKSFSMQGISDPATQRGIIPRAFEHIFENIQVSEGVKFLVRASYLEIYNEEIRDLLGKDHKVRLDLKEHPDKGVYVKDLSLHMVHNTRECEKVMELGWKNRSTGATLMNADSSRSHSIFTIHIEMCEADEKGEDHIRAGKLNLVDLAGSERQTKTGATGDRLKEATKINLSLSALGNVISALVDGKSKHIPYRDSKLTRLLQDSLGGNTKTLMVACLSPADNNYDETLSTLRYANRAKNIKNKPKINEDPKDALLREYQEEIKKLKSMLMGEIPVPQGTFLAGIAIPAPAPTEQLAITDGSSDILSPGSATSDDIEEEKERIKQEYEARIQEMQQRYEEEQSSKARLQQDMDQLKEYYEGKMMNVDGHKEERAPDSGESVPSKMDSTNDLPPTGSTPEAVEKGAMEEAEVEGGVTSKLSVLSVVGSEPSQPAVAQESSSENLEPVSGEAPSQGSSDEEIAETLQRNKAQDGLSTPRSSPTLPRKDVGSVLDQEEALKRLQQLEHMMVGGERASDENLKEKRRKKLKHAEVRKLTLAKAIAKMDDEGIMLNIYSSIEDELKIKNELLEKEKEKLRGAECEISDLNAEFEFERIDYLDTIRKQEKQLTLMQQLLEKVQPVIRRDCNYYNLDRIKSESQWDEESKHWKIPDMVITKDKLPTGAVLPGGRPSLMQQPKPSIKDKPMNGYINGYDGVGPRDMGEEDRYLQKLNRNNHDLSKDYFKPKRANQLLSSDINRNHLDSSNKFGSSGPGGLNNDMTAAAVHGQLGPSDIPMRRPLRLEALPTSKPKKGKKKSHNALEPL